MPREPKAKAPRIPKAAKISLTQEQLAAAKLAEKAAKQIHNVAMNTLKTLPLTPLKVFVISDPAEMDLAVAHFEKDGVGALSIFETEALRVAYCERAIRSITNSTLRACAYTTEIDNKLPYINDETDLKAMTGVFEGTSRAKGLFNAVGKSPFPHGGFGASAFGTSFNSEEIWELRGNELLAEFTRRVWGPGFEPHYTLDRSIFKVPNVGEDAINHTDRVPFAKTRDDIYKVIHGKMVLSEGGTFLCCPGSHLEEDEIERLYKPHYPNATGDKFGLNAGKPDPLNIFGRTVKYSIPQGVIVMWSTATWHAVVANQSGRVQYGFYVGFQSDVLRPRYKLVTSVDEVTDRYNTWRFGQAPRAYPSCDKVQLYPFRWKNFIRLLESYLIKVDKSSPRFDFSKREMSTKPGIFVPDMVEVPDPTYAPVRLSQLAREMLVGKDRVEAFDFGMA
ncbi:hypothetical protein T484DRAFT_1756085 [Baffinella frigidus]|nr:hypothetical protein T484DRAFT_1756085 [Cryptophyta sp. CCMP2293]